MAVYESVQGSPKSRLEHNLRTKKRYYNEDIDVEKSHLNYSVLSREGKDNLSEALRYIDQLLADAYVRKGNITTGEWVCTAPAELPEEQEKQFFESTYNFLNLYLFGGDDSRCISAQVHCDEAGQSHLHYIFALPEVKNTKYKDIKTKFKEGYIKANLSLSKADIKSLFDAVVAHEEGCPEKETIHKIKDILSVTRDEARSVFLKLRRRETEKYKTKLVSKDHFLTKDVFKKFHPEYQKWINNAGFKCDVFKGGGGINLSVNQLKELTKATGKKLNKNISVDFLAELINENERLKAQIKTLTQDNTRGWGDQREWGKEREATEWQR